jgi:CubicO group peptidase (beta-lactamase class C family)
MAENLVHGFVADKVSGVRDAFEVNLASGTDVGASCCATLEGETVVDLWGGFADAAKTRPWEKDTIVNVYSTTKTMTALLFADRGLLDFDAPVARYWPEFAAHGKSTDQSTFLQLVKKIILPSVDQRGSAARPSVFATSRDPEPSGFITEIW